MQRFNISRRARRRASIRRWTRRAGVVGLFAVLVGVPGASFGLDYLLARVSGVDGGLADQAIAFSSPQRPVLREQLREEVRETRPIKLPKPTPTPTHSHTAETATAPPAPATSVEGAIHAAAVEFGLDPDYLMSVAYCESTLDPGATNPAGYYGLFQFDQTTWAAYGYGSIYDPVAQARTAARLLAAGQASRWPNCA